VDGGATANDFLMQFQADVLNRPVVRPVVQETTALGAAYLAGLGVGFWSGREDLVRLWAEERRFLPATDGARREELCAAWARTVSRAAGWACAGA